MKKLILSSLMLMSVCSTAQAQILIAPTSAPLYDQCTTEYNFIVEQEQQNINYCNQNVYNPIDNRECQQSAILNANEQMNEIANCRDFYQGNHLLIVIGPMHRHMYPHRIFEHRHNEEHHGRR